MPGSGYIYGKPEVLARIMINRVILIIIGVIASLVVVIFMADVVRRFYMERRYRRLDGFRARYSPLVEEALSGKALFDAGRLMIKRHGSLERIAVEELLLDSLDNAKGVEFDRISSYFEELWYADEYLEKLKKGSVWEKALAIDKLGRIRLKRAVPFLIEALGGRHRDVRNMAANSLGLIHDPVAIGPLVKVFKNVVARGHEREASLRIIKSALIKFGKATFKHLDGELKNPDWRARSQAVDIFAEIADPLAEGALLEALKDDESDVRAKAAKGLGRIKSASAVKPLTGLLSDPSWVVRLHSVRALGVIGDVRAVPCIKQTMRDTNWQVRRASAEALKAVGKDAVFLLSDILFYSNDRYAREQVVEELERSGLAENIIDGLIDADMDKRGRAEKMAVSMGRNGGISPLIRAMESADPFLRKKMAWILGEVEDKRALEALSLAAKEDVSKEVRDEAEKALKKVSLTEGV